MADMILWCHAPCIRLMAEKHKFLVIKIKIVHNNNFSVYLNDLLIMAGLFLNDFQSYVSQMGYLLLLFSFSTRLGNWQDNLEDLPFADSYLVEVSAYVPFKILVVVCHKFRLEDNKLNIRLRYVLIAMLS